MLPLVLGSGIGGEAVRSLKCVQICGALLVWLGGSAVQLKFGGNYFLSPVIHSLIVHPCRGLLLLQIHEVEVDAVVGPWDEERVNERRLGVGS
jgi:hypothetical protein